MADEKQSAEIDMKRALLDPGSVFATPEDLLVHKELSTSQKLEILRRWEYDASESAVAVEEGMPDGNGELLQRILLAIGQLSAVIDMEKVGPSKQHGIPRSAVKRG